MTHASYSDALLADFAVAYSFWPDFIAQLVYSGWLVTGDATKRRSDGTFALEWLLPKLHQYVFYTFVLFLCPLFIFQILTLAPKLPHPPSNRKRCILTDWSDLSVRSSTVKRSSRFRLTVNRDPDATVWHIVEQHGDSWLYPKLRAAYLSLLRSNHTRTTCHVWSVELWREATPEELAEQQALIAALSSQGKTKVDLPVLDPPQYKTTADGYMHKIKDPDAPSRVHSLAYPGYVMVAGDLGVSVGGSYVSLTGWRGEKEDGAGTVLLVALGRLLASRGFKMWDFGMTMDYKLSLGAKTVPRKEFVSRLHATREEKGLWLGLKDGEARSAKDIIKEGEAACKPKTTATSIAAADGTAQAAADSAADAVTEIAEKGREVDISTAVDVAVAAVLASLGPGTSKVASKANTSAEVAATETEAKREGSEVLSKNEQKRRAKMAKKAEFKAAQAAKRAAAESGPKTV